MQEFLSQRNVARRRRADDGDVRPQGGHCLIQIGEGGHGPAGERPEPPDRSRVEVDDPNKAHALMMRSCESVDESDPPCPYKNELAWFHWFDGHTCCGLTQAPFRQAQILHVSDGVHGSKGRDAIEVLQADRRRNV